MFKKRYLFLIFIITLFAVSSVNAESIANDFNQSSNDILMDDSFTDFDELQNDINSLESGEILNLTKNYKYSNSSSDGIEISKPITINGNNFTIDGNGQSRIFNVLAENVTFNNLKLVNAYSQDGGAIFANQSITCNNVIFENNRAANTGGAVYVVKDINLTDCVFDGNHAVKGASLYFKQKFHPVINNSESYNLNDTFEDYEILGDGGDDSLPSLDTQINNVVFKNSNNYTYGEIFVGYETNILINNSIFTNLTSEYAPAIYFDMYAFFNISNTKFIDLYANRSGGAIAFISSVNGDVYNCTFSNTKAEKNGGAVYTDQNGWNTGSPSEIDFHKSQFVNCSSDFGGAITHLGGSLNIYECNFTDNLATYSGGAVYASGIYELNMVNSTFSNNKLTNADVEGLSFGGAVFADLLSAYIIDTEFINNSNNAVYCYDCEVEVNNSIFKNNKEAIRSIYTKSIDLNDNVYNDDIIIENDTDKYFNLIICGSGIELVLLNNTIDVENLPKRYNSADWGWVSSIKNQGESGACWCFSTLSTLESALLKATGVEYSLSIQNAQKMLLAYSKYGDIKMVEAGQTSIALQYILSWFGVFPEDYDTFDIFGKITRFISTPQNIHIQDAIVLYPDSADINDYKRTILKCGSVTTDILIDYNAPYFNNTTNALYYNGTEEEIAANHAVSIVGWDDNYPADNFLITPPGNGAFIIKNSYGSEKYDNGYIYVSYYDNLILKTEGVAFVIENTENYTKNYQTDMGGEVYYKNGSDNYSYKNSYQSIGNDLISAIGTYFYNSNEDYSFEIYVNDVLKLTQNGTSPFSGFHTIKLMKEIPIKTGDNFTVIMNTHSVPVLNNSRIHFKQNTSLIDDGYGWKDALLENLTVILKVYTKDLAIFTENLVKIYKNDSKFEANIGVANQTVTFEINGGVYNRTSDENGTAKIAINLNPGNYTIKTTFNGTTVENTITVLPTLIAQNLVKYYRNASQFYISLIDGAGNPVPYVNITMNINGVFYNRTTNENGTARLNINLNPGEYILTAIDPLTGLQMSYNITVLPVLTAEDINMTYKDGTQFKVNLVDGQGNPVANVNITMNINGVFYQRTTDENGTARLNINLMPGEYIITSQYDSAAISNKITIIAKED